MTLLTQVNSDIIDNLNYNNDNDYDDINIVIVSLAG